jgi:hypothetical protein
MPTSPEAIIAAITDASAIGFRGRLIARGQARAIIWRDGVLPPGAPGFSTQLSYDLHSYGYGLLGLGLRLLEIGGDPGPARIAFEQAATALEAVMAKGDHRETDRHFHFVMAAASYPPRKLVGSCLFAARHGGGGGEFLARRAGSCAPYAAGNKCPQGTSSYVSSKRCWLRYECP